MSQITGFGTYVPEKIIGNDYFEGLVDTNDEWIVSRTGIKTRRYSADTEFTSDMCIAAIKRMVKEYHVEIQSVDFIMVCTTTPDQTMPNTASRIQLEFGIENAGCIDLYAACAGFIYGLQVAHGFVNSGIFKKVLVCGAETLTKATDFEDRTSCILFGDGAGVAIVEPSDEEKFLAFNAGTNGEFGIDLYLSTKKDYIGDSSIKAHSKIVQNGRSVFKWAVGQIPEKIRELLLKASLSMENIDYVVPHSANLRILEAISKELGIPMSKIPESVSEFGNTSTASIPLALQKAKDAGILKKGQKLLLIGFGGGLTFAGCILEW